MKTIRISVSLFFIALLIFIMRNNLSNLWNCLKSIKMVYFFNAIFLFIFIIIIHSIRLKKIMELQGLSLILTNVFYLSLIGLFFNNFIPSSVAGDFVKAYYTAHYTNKALESYTSIIVDRLFGIFAFIFIAIVALIFADKNLKSPLVTNSILTLVIISFLLIFLLTNNFFSNILHKFLEKMKLLEIGKVLQAFLKSVKKYRNNFKIISFAFYASIISQIFSVFLVASLARGLSADVSLGLLFLTLPLITVLSMLPSINGLGIRESAYVFFLGKYLGREKALAISILWLGVILLVSFLGGIIYLFRDVLLKTEEKK